MPPSGLGQVGRHGDWVVTDLVTSLAGTLGVRSPWWACAQVTRDTPTHVRDAIDTRTFDCETLSLTCDLQKKQICSLTCLPCAVELAHMCVHKCVFTFPVFKHDSVLYNYTGGKQCVLCHTETQHPFQQAVGAVVFIGVGCGVCLNVNINDFAETRNTLVVSALCDNKTAARLCES